MTLARIDPQTNSVKTINGHAVGSGAVCVAGGLVWVTAHDIKTVRVLGCDPDGTLGAQSHRSKRAYGFLTDRVIRHRVYAFR